jgi:outer membrane protein assembly factor BamA
MKAIVCFALVFVAAVSVSAQRSRKQEAGPAAIAAIHATGSKRFPEADVVAATGLKKGQAAEVPDLENAAKALAATGAFREVNYSYQSGPGGLRVEFRVSDHEEFVPARFDNFAWLPPKQLVEKLHATLPLFTGELPVRGNLADQVQEELQTMLSGLGVAGTVRYDREKRGPDDPVTAISYTVEGVRTAIQKVNFPGVTAAMLPALEETADALSGAEYSLSRIQEFADKRLLPVYWRRGYARASLAGIVPVVVKTSTETTAVDLEISINEGLQYRLESVQFSGNKAFPTDRLSSMIREKSGEPLDLVRFNADIQSIGALFVSRGYVKARVNAKPTFNDAAGMVSYAVQITEGAVYRMGELDIIQFDQRNTSRLQEGWRLHKGEVFDATYPKRFVSEIVESGGAPVKIEENVHDSDKTVDIVLRPAE